MLENNFCVFIVVFFIFGFVLWVLYVLINFFLYNFLSFIILLGENKDYFLLFLIFFMNKLFIIRFMFNICFLFILFFELLYLEYN